MKNNNRILVTGATGFIGSHLVKRLVSDGWQVHIIVREKTSLDPLKDISNKIKVHCHNGSTENMLDIMAAVKPKLVFHLASLFLASHQPEELQPLIESNITFGAQLVEAMVRNNVFSLINAATPWQHYKDAEYNPVNLYAATKQAFKMILKYYLETTRLKVLTLILFDSYGPGDKRRKLVNLLLQTAVKKTKLKLSPGEQLVNLVNIEDITEAFIVAAKRINLSRNKEEEFAISSDKLVTLKALVKLFAKTVSFDLPVRLGARAYREREVMVPWRKGKKLPGWRPKIGLKQGIRQLLAGRGMALPENYCE